MSSEYIYDFMLHQTYSRLSGFLVNIAGLSVIMIAGLRLRSSSLSLGKSLILAAVGLCILAYTPLFIYFRAKKAEKESTFTRNIRYSFDENGITQEALKDSINNAPEKCRSDEVTEAVEGESLEPFVRSWQDLSKVISTPKTISCFINDTEAYIIPKKDFGDQFLPVMRLIFENMSKDKIYIRKFP